MLKVIILADYPQKLMIPGFALCCQWDHSAIVFSAVAEGHPLGGVLCVARRLHETALQAKDYVSAETRFSLSLSNSLDGPAYLGLAEALVDQGKTTDALQAYWLLFHPDAYHSWGGSYIPKADLEYALLLNQTGH